MAADAAIFSNQKNALTMSKALLMNAEPSPLVERQIRGLDTEDANAVLRHWTRTSEQELDSIMEECEGNFVSMLQELDSAWQTIDTIENRTAMLVDYARSKGKGWDDISSGQWWSRADRMLKRMVDHLRIMENQVGNAKGCEWVKEVGKAMAKRRVHLSEVNKR